MSDLDSCVVSSASALAMLHTGYALSVDVAMHARKQSGIERKVRGCVCMYLTCYANGDSLHRYIRLSTRLDCGRQ